VTTAQFAQTIRMIPTQPLTGSFGISYSATTFHIKPHEISRKLFVRFYGVLQSTALVVVCYSRS